MTNSQSQSTVNQAILCHCINCGTKISASHWKCPGCGTGLEDYRRHLETSMKALFCRCGAFKLGAPEATTAQALAENIRSGRVGCHCHNCGDSLLAAPRAVVR